MDYSEDLASRVRRALADEPAVTEAPLLGGKSFWVDDHLVISIQGDELLVRVSQADYQEVLANPGARPYEFASRPVPAWVMVAAEAIAADEKLVEWVNLGLTSPTE